MKAFHDSRDVAYRAPYGALALGKAVTLALDVWEAPGAEVTLRTWIDGVGETLYPMKPQADAPGRDGATRYAADLAPQAAGVVWYQFIVATPDGRTQRYGARDGMFGGVGALRDWEPPSFKLTVSDPESNLELSDAEADEIDRSFADGVFGFLKGDLNAGYLAETLETLRENLPAPTLLRRFNAFDGASCPDVMACLAGVRTHRDALFRAEDVKGLDAGMVGLAKGRLWCASLIQMLLPAKPVLGRADADPVAGALPAWDYLDADCEAIIQNTLDIRQALPLFHSGSWRAFAANDDVFGIWRCAGDGTDACILVNRSLQNAHDIPIPMVAEAVSEVVAGYGVPVVNAADTGVLPEGIPAAERYARVHLHQLGSAILYFHPRQRLQQPMEPGVGVLAHITSLPAETPDAPGTLGAPARAFVDWLAKAGVRYWQVLPVNPTDEYGSPYAGISAFAGNVRLLEGGMDVLDDFEASPEYLEFCWREADWLEPYATFMAIREKLGGNMPWQEWPEGYRGFDPGFTDDDPELDFLSEKWRRLQFAFEQQWRSLRTYANERGVCIVGDMPIYVSADSSDVWAYPSIFQLDENGKPGAVAGCPPDAFAEDGQVWGNPVYDWDVLTASGYEWWLRRLERAFDLYDCVRLDHFIGFCRYFSIPAGQKATKGSYRPGPGIGLFQAARQAFGPLPIIAEDLGLITPAVRTLVAACGFPGMDIVQFADGNDPLSGYAPRPEKVAYTGTHDNQTLVGYVQARYPERDAEEAANALVDMVVACGADVRIVPLQDVLGLDDEARMNTPGVPEGNWTWQADEQAVRDATARLRELVAGE